MNTENTNGKTRKPRAVAPEYTITLTTPQLEKLWAIAIGGQLSLYTDDSGQINARVTLASFAQALPILIDRL